MNGFFRRNGVFAVIEIAGRLPLLFTVGYTAATVGASVYGDWALVLATVGVLTGLGGLGLNSAIARMASGEGHEYARGYLVYALRTCAALVLAIGVLLLIAHEPIGRLLGISPGSRNLLALGGVIALTGTVDALFDAYFKARERLRRQAAFVLGRTCIEVAVVAVVFGTDLFGTDDPQTRLALYVALTSGARFLGLYPLLLLGREGHELPDRAARRTFVRYGLPMVPAAPVLWLTTQGDRLVLGHAVSSTQLGWYAFGAGLAANFSYLGLAVYPLLLPRASVLFDSGDRAAVAQLFDSSQRVYLALYAGVAVALALLAPDVIRATAGDEFAPSAPILLLLALAVGLEGLIGIFQWVFHLVKRTSLVLATNLVYMALQIGAVFTVATVTGDILAVAWTVLGVVVVANAIRYMIARRFRLIHLRPALVAGLGALGVVVFAAAEIGQDWPLGIRLALAGLAGAAGVLGALRAAGVDAPRWRSVRLGPKVARS